MSLMMATEPGDITQLLAEHQSGDAQALRTLLAHAYPQLRERAHQLMAREKHRIDVQATGLVNDLVIKALKSDLPVNLNDRVHFMNIMSRMMKEILIDHSRKRNSLKRGGGEGTWRLSQSDEPSESSEIDFDSG
ncbi:MAG: ECF-type sigma factor, partial [Phycisphaerales bacterium]|nr:ECF-type sigma factor [Phycisphaerales bacterium]